MSSKPTRFLAAGAAVAMLFVTACGDDDKTASKDATTTEAPAVATTALKGASVDASAPATVAAGQPVPVTIKVEGLTLVKADGDTSGTTGHLHLFVDREPTPAGQPIPTGQADIIHSAATEVPVPNLAAGEHTIWVVAGDGTHTPLNPAVKDKVTVTVS